MPWPNRNIPNATAFSSQISRREGSRWIPNYARRNREWQRTRHEREWQRTRHEKCSSYQIIHYRFPSLRAVKFRQIPGVIYQIVLKRINLRPVIKASDATVSALNIEMVFGGMKSQAIYWFFLQLTFLLCHKNNLVDSIDMAETVQLKTTASSRRWARTDVFKVLTQRRSNPRLGCCWMSSVNDFQNFTLPWLSPDTKCSLLGLQLRALTKPLCPDTSRKTLLRNKKLGLLNQGQSITLRFTN